MGQVKISLQKATDRQLDQKAAPAKVAKAALVCDLVEEALAPRKEGFSCLLAETITWARVSSRLTGCRDDGNH